jgi:hypothetical protein
MPSSCIRVSLASSIHVGQLLASSHLLKRARVGSVSEPFHIAQGRQAKQAFVFPIEVRHIILSDTGSRACRSEASFQAIRVPIAAGITARRLVCRPSPYVRLCRRADDSRRYRCRAAWA